MDAAKIIRAGGLVAFPTETVYGLGANALDAYAVAKIFEAKGRPKSSPLIVHVAYITMARELSSKWSAAAEALAQHFWPGPLTLVVPKIPAIPDIVTAGLNSVGLRIPAHPLALQLLKAAAVPIAAPSANRFTELSPTTAEHVRHSFGEQFPILDGGPCQVGIESTVFHVESMSILRPGMVTREQIEQVVGPVRMGGDSAESSPGQHPQHYQPRTKVILGTQPDGNSAYLWHTQERPARKALQMPENAANYAAILYSTLHDLDPEAFEAIVIEPPPAGSAWDGIRDRLIRANSTPATAA
jgi:L-threonylcarbamoyladenylate synthase